MAIFAGIAFKPSRTGSVRADTLLKILRSERVEVFCRGSADRDGYPMPNHRFKAMGWTSDRAAIAAVITSVERCHGHANLEAAVGRETSGIEVHLRINEAWSIREMHLSAHELAGWARRRAA